MNKKMRKGFTLTELIIVIVIIGILAAVLIPTLTQYIGRSQQGAAEEEARSQLTVIMNDAVLTKETTYINLVQGKVFVEDSARGYRMFFDKGALVSTEKISARATANTLDLTGTNAGTYNKLEGKPNTTSYTLTIAGAAYSVDTVAEKVTPSA